MKCFFNLTYYTSINGDPLVHYIIMKKRERTFTAKLYTYTKVNTPINNIILSHIIMMAEYIYIVYT